MLQLNSLQKKVAVLIILPLCLVLLSTGFIGMRMIGRVLLHQWEETAISKMERSAHNVDMRLMRPKEILLSFQKNRQPQLSMDDVRLLLNQLRSIDGVIDVKYNFKTVTKGHQDSFERMPGLMGSSISPLVYNTALKSQTVSIVTKFQDASGTTEFDIEVIVGFYDLIKQIVKAPWWKGNKAYILDRDGTILASTGRDSIASDTLETQNRFFDPNGTIEARTWHEIQHKKSGTVFSPGLPPKMVSGYYHLTEAPWTLVVTAEGASVLKPIISFRNYYFLICSIGILCVAFYLWFIARKATNAINRISSAATRLAGGVFDAPLTVTGKDEIGDLTNSFNIMSKQLSERLQLRQDMNLAGEVQANLLPQMGFELPGLEIATLSKYCDKTGGDYVDILNTSVEDKQATVVVGDVVGHGVGAALLMATLRALLRCRSSMTGSRVDIIGDVNRLLCDDTIRFGNFATLFYLTIDRAGKSLHWIRCGHDQALVFCPKTDSFSELTGEGMVLGVTEEYKFVENSCHFFEDYQIILVGTDGIWEVENPDGETFGKERVKDLLKKHAYLSATEIAGKILAAIELFCGDHKQSDDITLAIIKTLKVAEPDTITCLDA